MKINVNKLDINIIECNNLFLKIKGFMFYKDKITHGLIFKKCNAIHTFFMCQPIDVIMTDKNNNLLLFFEQLPPNKMIFPKKGVYYTYELPLGSIKKLNIK